MSSTASLADILALSRSRWIIPLLADIAAHEGARFAALLSRLAIPRDSLARTLELAREAGWIIPNPGHGHPLRPELVLTDEGRRLAVSAAAIAAAQTRVAIAPADLTRWSLPLLHVMDGGERRFSGFERALPQATPRAISQGLRAMTERSLVVRSLVDDFPPVTAYALTESGMVLAQAA